MFIRLHVKGWCGAQVTPTPWEEGRGWGWQLSPRHLEEQGVPPAPRHHRGMLGGPQRGQSLEEPSEGREVKNKALAMRGSGGGMGCGQSHCWGEGRPDKEGMDAFVCAGWCAADTRHPSRPPKLGINPCLAETNNLAIEFSGARISPRKLCNRLENRCKRGWNRGGCSECSIWEKSHKQRVWCK